MNGTAFEPLALSDETFVVALCCVALLAGLCWGIAEIHARWFPDDLDEDE